MSVYDFADLTIKAKTHHAGYSFHKYWARKPHNVVRRTLEVCDVREGSVVIDPFCGSGVPLSEAAALGARCIGVDVNPIAVELTRLTLSPPDPHQFKQAFEGLLDSVEKRYSERYELGGRRIRYVVHATVVLCPGCARRVSAESATRERRSYYCPDCHTKLNFNLEHLVATRRLRVALEGDVTEEFSGWNEDSNARMPGHLKYDQEFEQNRRILAYKGMTTRRLFTDRNFEVLSAVADAIEGLPESLRPAARLTLTGAAAQCSRLIAYRNDMTTGGPAWTVPGFWVPPIHLETNPLTHLRARLRRTVNGLMELSLLPGRGTKHSVVLGDSAVVLDGALKRGFADVAFIDPPYGDSVPYLEFSALWNSFLGSLPDPGRDIAVSNRSRGDGSWDAYRNGLGNILAAVKRGLKSDGRLIVTFNNKDVRAWEALLYAIQATGFRCEGAFYQHPAVVSAKAQLAPTGSYVGDIYAVFVGSQEGPSTDLSPVAEALSRASSEAGPQLDTEGQRRLAISVFVERNIKAALMKEIPALLDNLGAT